MMKLGYLLSRYPLISETFILREMQELRRMGHRLEIAPLLRAPARLRHAGTAELADQVRWHPWLSAQVGSANLSCLLNTPLRAARLWAEALAGCGGDRNLLAGALVFWPKAVAIAERFQRAGVEHVHAHYGTHPALVAWIIRRLTGIPYSFTVHAHDLFVHPCMLAKKTAEAAFVAVISDYNRARLAELCGEDSSGHIRVVRCGIRPEQFPVRGAPSPGSRLRMVTVASLQPYKGHRYLVEACVRLRSRQIPFECRLVGGGELEQPLRRQIARLGLGESIQMTGPATEQEVVRELEQADLFVLPSIREPSGKMEGIPVALMEAMAAGLPVVTSRLSGIPELVGDGIHGFLVEPGDAGALAAALERLRSPGLRGQMGAAGRERVLRDYDLHHNVRRLERYFLESAGVDRQESGRVAA